MRHRGIDHRLAIWLAFLSVSLYALWPLLATMQPRGLGTHYELCPHAALHQMAEQSGHEPPSRNPIWNEHQLQCVFSLGIGDGGALAPTAPVVLVLDAGSSVIHHPVSLVVGLASRFYATAPRGPPSYS